MNEIFKLTKISEINLDELEGRGYRVGSEADMLRYHQVSAIKKHKNLYNFILLPVSLPDNKDLLNSIEVLRQGFSSARLFAVRNGGDKLADISFTACHKIANKLIVEMGGESVEPIDYSSVLHETKEKESELGYCICPDGYINPEQLLSCKKCRGLVSPPPKKDIFEISDEDAIEVAIFYWGSDKKRQTVEQGKSIIKEITSNDGSVISPMEALPIFKLLELKNYEIK